VSAHTPGPWETSVNDEGQWDVCAEGGGDMVADLSDCPENAEGNARLIAAAPELLAELRCVVESFRDEPRIGSVEANFIRREWFERAVAAIAKAEGQS